MTPNRMQDPLAHPDTLTHHYTPESGVDFKKERQSVYWNKKCIQVHALNILLADCLNRQQFHITIIYQI